eukprot:2335806-Pyramimonas_sp.AAC.1
MGTILAGCNLATTFAKVVLYRLLVAVTAAFPSRTMRNVIDDVSIQALGTGDFVCEQLGKAAIMMKGGFEQLKLILSGKKA